MTLERPDPQGILNKFISRNKEVVDGNLVITNNLFHSARKETAENGQAPHMTVIACSDSRVPVEEIFAAYPGELFVIKTAGNVLDDIGKASLEYAIEHLPTSVILVLGHTQCGAVNATIQAYTSKSVVEGHLGVLVEKITPAVRDAIKTNKKDDLANTAIINNTKAVVQDIISTIPSINPLLNSKKILLQKAIYHLETGEVELLE